ncbi:MAG: CbiX/SirB N-terminal domain-containing protein [Planctomycetaceae bacterium]
MNLTAKKQGILLIAHGSRQGAANDDLVELAEQIRQRRPGEHVELAYLELAEPTIPQGAARCVAAGVTRVLMLPYFLSAGAHVTKDLERFREEFSQSYREIEFELCAPLGLHPLIVDVVLARLAEQE